MTCLDKLCLAAAGDGILRVGTLRRGYRAGMFNLIQSRGTLENVALAWASPVMWIRPN